jgi:hypothetical protein
MYASTTGIPVTGNAPYAFGATINVATVPAGATTQAFVQWYDANNSLISQSNVVVAAGTGVKTFSLPALTAPANAVTAALLIGIQEAGTFGAIDFSIDKIFLSRESLVYIDGDMAGYYWNGTPGNSVSGNAPSMYTPVRRQQPTRFNGPWAKTFQIMLTSQYAPLFSAAQVIIGPAASINTENYGNYPAAPVLRVFGPGSGSTFTVANSTTGQFINVVGPSTLGAGHYLDIDVLNHTATDDTGVSWNRYLNFATSTWPTVTPRVVSTWTVGASLTLQATYRHCWV